MAAVHVAGHAGRCFRRVTTAPRLSLCTLVAAEQRGGANGRAARSALRKEVTTVDTNCAVGRTGANENLQHSQMDQSGLRLFAVNYPQHFIHARMQSIKVRQIWHINYNNINAKSIVNLKYTFQHLPSALEHA